VLTAILPRPVDREPRQASWIGVVAIVVAVIAVAVIGGTVMNSTVREWYHTIPKPAWTPPDWVFGPVWMILYTMMATAASIVWLERKTEDICCPIGAFSIQLVLNLAWSLLFFGLRSPLLGFIDICVLWIAAGVAMTQFFLVSRTAGWLMVPYWLWITFAGALNGSIVLLGG